jgi:hypothetical protein
MKFLDSTKPHRKSGGSPHHCFCPIDAEVCAVAPLWESNGNKSLSSQVPRISCRGWWRCRPACGFPYRKPQTRFCLVLRNRKFGSAGANLGLPALRLGAIRALAVQLSDRKRRLRRGSQRRRSRETTYRGKTLGLPQRLSPRHTARFVPTIPWA